MTSPLQQAIAGIQQNNYLSLAVIVAVGYDHVLTFSKEIEYIWRRPWTWVSTLFVLARYFGLCYIISSSINGSSFFRGPDRMYVYTHRLILIDTQKKLIACRVIYSLSLWCYYVFLFAAELVMILRVRALYNRSKLVLGTLLVFYAMEVASLFVYYVRLDTQPGYISQVRTIQVLQFSFCVLPTEPIKTFWLEELFLASMLTLGVSMCLLTATAFIKELHESYKATKFLQLNRYMKYLMRDAMVYFIVILLFALTSVLNIAGVHTADDWLYVVQGMLQSILPVTLVPRFVMGLRELYARDSRAVRGNNIDTPFGFGTEIGSGVVRSRIVFADRENEDKEMGDGEGDPERPCV